MSPSPRIAGRVCFRRSDRGDLAVYSLARLPRVIFHFRQTGKSKTNDDAAEHPPRRKTNMKRDRFSRTRVAAAVAGIGCAMAGGQALGAGSVSYTHLTLPTS